jgi:ATP-dependent Clp protease adapter protein ClpS
MAEANVNMKVEETTTESTTEQPVEQPAQAPAQRQVSLLQIPVNTENDALNMLVAFLQVAQKRGAFSLEEAYKIMESVNVFQKNVPQQPATEQLPTVEEEK